MLRNMKGDDGIIIHHYKGSKKQMNYDFIAKTDYTEGSDIDIYIKEKLDEIALRSNQC